MPSDSSSRNRITRSSSRGASRTKSSYRIVASRELPSIRSGTPTHLRQYRAKRRAEGLRNPHCIRGGKAVASVAHDVDEARVREPSVQKLQAQDVLWSLLDEGPALAARFEQAHGAIEEIDQVARLAKQRAILLPRQAKMAPREYILIGEETGLTGDREQPAVRGEHALNERCSAARRADDEDGSRRARCPWDPPGKVPWDEAWSAGVRTEDAQEAVHDRSYEVPCGMAKVARDRNPASGVDGAIDADLDPDHHRSRRARLRPRTGPFHGRQMGGGGGAALLPRLGPGWCSEVGRPIIACRHTFGGYVKMAGMRERKRSRAWGGEHRTTSPARCRRKRFESKSVACVWRSVRRRGHDSSRMVHLHGPRRHTASRPEGTAVASVDRRSWRPSGTRALAARRSPVKDARVELAATLRCRLLTEDPELEIRLASGRSLTIPVSDQGDREGRGRNRAVVPSLIDELHEGSPPRAPGSSPATGSCRSTDQTPSSIGLRSRSGAPRSDRPVAWSGRSTAWSSLSLTEKLRREGAASDDGIRRRGVRRRCEDRAH